MNDRPVAPRIRLKWSLPALALAGAAVVVAASTQPGRGASQGAVPAPAPAAPVGPVVRAGSDVEAGRYLVLVGGCNDCHTPGYAQTGGRVPESLWLTGSPVGFRGPWGTTYASNLRRTLKDMKPDDWVAIARTRRDKPPMPWPQLHYMSEPDLRAVYAFVKSLPVAGEATPPYVPPGQEPQTPYVDMMPKNLPAAAAAATPSK